MSTGADATSRRRNTHFRRSGGFTLIELLAVVAVIGILLTTPATCLYLFYTIAGVAWCNEARA
jgi:prepilin-type N-terminal cleavage/methylation domain-containing protein